MKRILILAIGVLVLFSSCATILGGLFGELFPAVDPPDGPAASMLMVELIAFTEGEAGTEESRNYNNLVNSGFYPVVTDTSGREVRFGNIDSLANNGMVYWAENLEPGEYKLEGFRYLWMTHDDFMTTPIKDLKFDGQNEAKWQKRNFYDLPESVKIEIGSGTIVSLGKYSVYYTLRGIGDEKDNIVSWEYRLIDPSDREILSQIKPWRSGNWPEWNERNPVE